MILARKARTTEVVEEIKSAISRRWPEAKFRTSRMNDARGTALWAYSKAGFWDVTALTDDIQERAMEESGIFVYVIPQPLEAWEG